MGGGIVIMPNSKFEQSSRSYFALRGDKIWPRVPRYHLARGRASLERLQPILGILAGHGLPAAERSKGRVGPQILQLCFTCYRAAGLQITCEDLVKCLPNVGQIFVNVHQV